jgi:hypothetical protein
MILAEKCRQKALLLIVPLRVIAHQGGYAIGVHGSLARDIDLIAVPWIEDAVPARALAEALIGEIERVNGVALVINNHSADLNDYTQRNPQQKPHGRLAWAIHLGGGPYIDLSIIAPRWESGAGS